MNLGTATVVRADARTLPLADNSVDLIVTSPPYFSLRSYTDGGEHYAGQLGSEDTPEEFVHALLEVTRELVRVLKPTGSLFVNLGDKYAERGGPPRPGHVDDDGVVRRRPDRPVRGRRGTIRAKSLMGLPWRYALGCIDELDLILRSELVWDKPNGIPESVADRVRRSHEQWFHLVQRPRYFSAIDEIREPHTRLWGGTPNGGGYYASQIPAGEKDANLPNALPNPLGKLPGSVWRIATEPLTIPADLDVEHFAAFPTEWPKRLIQGWSPTGICTACDQPLRPTTSTEHQAYRAATSTGRPKQQTLEQRHRGGRNGAGYPQTVSTTQITGYVCGCEHPDAPTRPAVVLDPFGGTGTTALVAKALGRHGISVDLSADYCRVARWRTNDRNQLAKILALPRTDPTPADQLDLFTL